jgi:hypothetical protein
MPAATILQPSSAEFAQPRTITRTLIIKFDVVSAFRRAINVRLKPDTTNKFDA